MKKLITVLLLTSTIIATAQHACDDNYAAAGVGYILTKAISADISYFTRVGLTAGIGAAYNPPKKFNTENESVIDDSAGNCLSTFVFVGWRALHSDYQYSVYGNIGLTMGDSDPLKPFVSVRTLFPVGQKAISVEPLYVLDRGFNLRLSIHFKL